MKFKSLFIVTLFVVLVCLGGVSYAAPELKVISAELEKDVLKQGESTKVVVTIKNTGNVSIYDVSFGLGVSKFDAGEITISSYDRLRVMESGTTYHIDFKKMSLAPKETKTATYIVTAAAPKKEEYVLGFIAGGRLGKDTIMYRDTLWWPGYLDYELKVYLKAELPQDYYFKKAEEYLKSGSYENADYYAKKAREVYVKYGNATGASSCDSIILLSEKMLEANVEYKRAKRNMNEGNLQGAIDSAESSLKIYKEIDSLAPNLVSGNISEVGLMIQQINKKITAWGYFLNATIYLDSENYEKAKEYAEKAKAIYIEMGDTNSTLKCNSIINNSEVNMSRSSLFLQVVYVAVILIFLLFVLLFYTKYRDRKYRERH